MVVIQVKNLKININNNDNVLGSVGTINGLMKKIITCNQTQDIMIIQLVYHNYTIMANISDIFNEHYKANDFNENPFCLYIVIQNESIIKLYFKYAGTDLQKTIVDDQINTFMEKNKDKLYVNKYEFKISFPYKNKTKIYTHYDTEIIIR